jgi:hypothetical protein
MPTAPAAGTASRRSNPPLATEEALALDGSKRAFPLAEGLCLGRSVMPTCSWPATHCMKSPKLARSSGMPWRARVHALRSVHSRLAVSCADTGGGFLGVPTLALLQPIHPDARPTAVQAVATAT